MSRRLKLGIAAIVHVDVFFVVGVITKNIEAVYNWALAVAGICLFVGGFITITDFIKIKNGKS